MKRVGGMISRALGRTQMWGAGNSGAVFSGVLAGLLVLGGAETARAACTPAAADNVTATCTGTTVNQNGNNGYGTGLETNLNVTVVSGASVQGTLPGIYFASGTVSNSGAINGFISSGILTTADANITNSGTISSQLGDGAYVAGNGTLHNTGTITGSLAGFFVFGSSNVVNTGTIVTTAAAGVGISAIGNANITNTGTIFGGIVGIETGRPANVTNAGVISGGFAALLFGLGIGGTADTLTLLPGSRIIGAIDLGGVGDTVNFRGGNNNLTFDTLAGATVTSTTPFVVSGNRAVAVDATAFGMADRNLMDFTGAVSAALPTFSPSANVPAGPPATAFAEPDRSDTAALVNAIPALAAYADATPFQNRSAVYQDGSIVWSRGFGGQRIQQAGDGLLHSNNQFYGGMIGTDWQSRSNLRIGVFAGGGNIRSDTTANIDTSNSTLGFAGGYVRQEWADSFLQAGLQAGWSSNDTSRLINNNTLANGLETAKGSFNGWYVNPELTYGVNRTLGVYDGGVYALTPSVRLRYLYASFGGYSESGSSANMSVGSHVAQDLEERGELKLTRTQAEPGGALIGNISGGVIGQQRVGGDTIGATLLGQALPFSAPGKSNLWGGYGGAGVEWRTGAISVFAAGDYTAYSDSSSIVSGRGGVRVAF